MQHAPTRGRLIVSWAALRVSPNGTHHVRDDGPAYDERFDDVLPFQAPGVAAVRRGGEAWHIHPDGRPSHRGRFMRTFGFYEGRAAVMGIDGWHHILAHGLELTEARYAWCGNYQDGRCTVRAHNGRYFHITPGGARVYAETWKYAGDYREGVAVVQADDGRSTHVDGRGRVIHERWFVDLDVFHKGYARARDTGGWHHIDREGHAAYASRFAMVEPFYNGQARVERFDGGLSVIDETGVVTLELWQASY